MVVWTAEGSNYCLQHPEETESLRLRAQEKANLESLRQYIVLDGRRQKPMITRWYVGDGLLATVFPVAESSQP